MGAQLSSGIGLGRRPESRWMDCFQGVTNETVNSPLRNMLASSIAIAPNRLPPPKTRRKRKNRCLCTSH